MAIYSSIRQYIMLNSLIRFSIRNKLIVGLMVLVLIAFGSYALTKLPIDAVPDITDNQVLIITTTPSLGAPEVERLITFPIEQAMANVPNIVEMRSFSRFGLSLVTVVFTHATDVYWARHGLRCRVPSPLCAASAEAASGCGPPFLAQQVSCSWRASPSCHRPRSGTAGTSRTRPYCRWRRAWGLTRRIRPKRASRWCRAARSLRGHRWSA